MSNYPFNESLKREYREMFDAALIRSGREDEVAYCVGRIEKFRDRYEKISAAVGCPWWFVGLIHGMESSFRDGWLANGDSLNGPTVHVPKGLVVPGKQPPYDFIDAGIVSLKHDGLDTNRDWSLEKCLYLLEAYNGFGYRMHGDNSDYLWSFTNFEKAGRYTADGAWDANAWSDQVGCVAMLKGLVAKGWVDFSTPPRPEVGVDDRVTWAEFFRLDQDGRTSAGIVAMEGATPRVLLETNDLDSLLAFRKRFPNARTFQVAPHTKPWPTLQPAPKPEPVEVFVKVTRIAPGVLNADGLEDLKLELVGTAEPAWTVQSGRVGRQNFRKGGVGDGGAGTGWPCPQGEYIVRDFRWYGGKDDWNASGGAGLGPLFIPFDPKFETGRSAFGIHWDSNHPSNTSTTRESPAAGSAGCLVHRNMSELKRFAQALRKHDPRKLVVDWGL